MKLNYKVDLHKDEEEKEKVNPKTRLSMQATAEKALATRMPTANAGPLPTGTPPGTNGW